MAEQDKSTERQFVRELVDATRAGRVAWTGTIRPGCYQYSAGDYLVTVANYPEGIAIVLHHCSGHQLDALRAVPTEGDEMSALFAELLELARTQSLGLRSRWQGLGKQLANAPAAAPQSEG